MPTMLQATLFGALMAASLLSRDRRRHAPFKSLKLTAIARRLSSYTMYRDSRSWTCSGQAFSTTGYVWTQAYTAERLRRNCQPAIVPM